MNDSSITNRQFTEAFNECRELFVLKLKDYGASWRLMRPSSLTDQILIKANRIRTLETTGEAKVDEGIRGEFIGIVNYGIIALIQLSEGYSDCKDMSVEHAIELYDHFMKQTKDLMIRKNHDYGEIWRSMRVSSYTDLILTKIMRTKEIEDNGGHAAVSEGIDANYMDMINYSIFALIKLGESQNQ